MADLIQSVDRTVYPNGKTVRYEHGMLFKPPVPTAELEHKLKIWWRWLSILKAKYHWTDELKQHLYED